ncbi:MAG: hypothetical protein VCC67_04980 [Myxococcota bacterium]
MLKLMNDRAIFVGMTVAIAIVAIATPSMAHSVYAWTTEEGTAAYTNDPKRIPEKYKDTATHRTLGKLKNYPRLSKSDLRLEKTYSQRVQARLEKLRAGLPSVSAGPAAAEHPITIDVGMGSGKGSRDQVSIPVAARGGAPIVTEELSVRMRDGIATRNVQITRQGGEILSVRIARKNQRKINERMTDASRERLLRGIDPN